jgi:phospholipase D1/2
VAGIEESIGRGKGSTQLYATIDLGRARVGRTRVITGDPENPRWYEDFHIYCAHFAADVVFSVKVAQPISATLIGRAYLPVKDLLDAQGQEIERRLEVVDARRKKLCRTELGRDHLDFYREE